MRGYTVAEAGAKPGTVPATTRHGPLHAAARNRRGRSPLLDVALLSRRRRRRLIREIEAAPGVGMRTGTKVGAAGAFPRGLEAQAGSVSTPRRLSAERALYRVRTDSPRACA